jgi:hypothetical protein
MNSEYKRLVNSNEYYITADGFLFRKVGPYEFKKINGSVNKESGYVYINYKLKNGTWKHGVLHTLIAKAFIPKPKYARNLEVNHKNGDKTDNSVSNLEWVTRQKNMALGWESGQFDNVSKAIKDKRKKLNGLQTNLTPLDVRQIRHLRKEGLSNRQVGHIFQLHPMQVSRIANYRSFRNVN